MNTAVIIDAVRTPVARAHPENGYYREVRADDLSAELIRTLLVRNQLPPDSVEDVVWGCVQQQGEQGMDMARIAGLLAGLAVESAGVTVNRNCGSSLQAINQAALSIMGGTEDIQIAGGVEHMHHIPMTKDYSPNPRLFTHHSPAIMNMGLTAEHLAIKYKISRQEQDSFALRSHQRAASATQEGAFDSEVIPTWGRNGCGIKEPINRDQSIRKDTSLEALTALPPVFNPHGGTVTAGNASPTSVGAAALLMMSETTAKERGLTPMVKVRSMAVAGVDPSIMGIGPVPATHKALARANLSLQDIDLIEINEAFAVQTLSVIKTLKADPEKVNVRGGAVAIGHPLGASGARITTTLLHLMRDQNASLGLSTMCIGAGQGIATIFETYPT